MSCPQQYANAFDYAMLWQCEAVTSGVTTSGTGAGTLTDADADFIELRVAAGMWVYNASRNTYGRITAVASGELLTTNIWYAGDVYQIAHVTTTETAIIDTYLRLAAGDINAARNSVGACDCTIDSAVDLMVRKLNCIIAAVSHHCPCAQPHISDEMRTEYLRWASDMLAAIRNGKLELCQGETGSEYPAMATAERAWTDWAAAEIELNRIARES